MINKVIEDLNTVSLFGEKLIEVFNIDKLEDAEKIIKYLDNQGDNTLVLISYKELDKRKKLTKALKEKTEYKELFNYNFSKFIKDNLEEFGRIFVTVTTDEELMKILRAIIDQYYNNIKSI